MAQRHSFSQVVICPCAGSTRPPATLVAAGVGRWERGVRWCGRAGKDCKFMSIVQARVKPSVLLGGSLQPIEDPLSRVDCPASQAKKIIFGGYPPLPVSFQHENARRTLQNFRSGTYTFRFNDPVTLRIYLSFHAYPAGLCKPEGDPDDSLGETVGELLDNDSKLSGRFYP